MKNYELLSLVLEPSADWGGMGIASFKWRKFLIDTTRDPRETVCGFPLPCDYVAVERQTIKQKTKSGTPAVLLFAIGSFVSMVSCASSGVLGLELRCSFQLG